MSDLKRSARKMVTLKPIAAVLDSTELVGRIPRELVALAERVAPWTSYAAFAGSIPVGACAFKNPPVSGDVEVAFFTFSELEGRGYGTAMAESLVVIAFRSGEASRVIAHTLREENASVRICRRLGFALEGEILDPEDGLVWRWIKKGPNQPPQTTTGSGAPGRV